MFATGRANSLLTEAMAQYAALRAAEAICGAEAAKEFRWRGYPGKVTLDPDYELPHLT